MKLTVAAVGRLRPALFAPAAEEYLGRIKRYATTHVVEIREVHERSMVEAQPLESKALLEATRSCNFRIALDSRGEMVDSVALARKLEKAMQFGPDHWGLMLGGSHGHDAALLQACDWRWSLGPMTLPHELARVVVFEQIYRGFSIVRGEPYHK